MGGDGDGEISLRTDSPIAPRETYIDRVPSRIRCFLRHVFFPRVDDRSCDIWPSSLRREKHINRELPYRWPGWVASAQRVAEVDMFYFLTRAYVSFSDHLVESMFGVLARLACLRRPRHARAHASFNE